MTESVLIVLPLPHKIIHPNATIGSWRGRMGKAAAAKAYRAKAKAAAEDLAVESGPWARATVQVTFFHDRKRRRDDVNFLAAMKPAYDGLVDAGLLEDDDAEHLTTLPARFELDRDAPRVELLVERVA